jgi:hypothetical protein
MAWETEFTDYTPGKRPKRVEYQTLAQVGWSLAERRDRVTVSGKVVHAGWVSDHRGYAVYQSLVQEWYATEDKGLHNPLCPNRVFHSNPAHVCEVPE